MKKVIIVLALLSIFGGFVVGFFFDFPPKMNHHVLSGDVAQAKRFKKEVVQASHPLLSYLQSDTLQREHTRRSLALMVSLVQNFSLNVQWALESGKGIAALQESLAPMRKIQGLSRQTEANITCAQWALAAGLKGEPIDIETSFNQALLSFSLLDKQLSMARPYVEAVDAYLQGKDVNKHVALTFARDRWADLYLTQCALMGREAELQKFMHELKPSGLQGPTVEAYFRSLLPTQRLIVSTGLMLRGLISMNRLTSHYIDWAEKTGIVIVYHDDKLLGWIQDNLAMQGLTDYAHLNFLPFEETNLAHALSSSRDGGPQDEEVLKWVMAKENDLNLFTNGDQPNLKAATEVMLEMFPVVFDWFIGGFPDAHLGVGMATYSPVLGIHNQEVLTNIGRMASRYDPILQLSECLSVLGPRGQGYSGK